MYLKKKKRNRYTHHWGKIFAVNYAVILFLYKCVKGMNVVFLSNVLTYYLKFKPHRKQTTLKIFSQFCVFFFSVNIFFRYKLLFNHKCLIYLERLCWEKLKTETKKNQLFNQKFIEKRILLIFFLFWSTVRFRYLRML